MASALSSRPRDPLETVLREIVGEAQLVTDPAVLVSRLQDWTGRWHGECRLAVAPASGAETSAVLERCAASGARVVVQGGNTGLVGGAVPVAGDVLLLTTGLTHIDAPDEVAHTVIAGAGVTLAELQRHLRPYDLEFAVDLGARDSATLGGMAATNAGGLHVLRHGDMRRQVLSVDAYDAGGGQIAALHPLVKDNTGYALSALLIGSEGTLGVITRLLLRVIHREEPGAVVVLGLPDISAVAAVVAGLRRQTGALRAIEAMSAAVCGAVASARGQEPPVEAPWMLLLETASDATTGALVGQLERALAAVDCADAPIAVADDVAGMRALWRWRDGATEAISRRAAERGERLLKLDVSVPTAALSAFAGDVDALFAERPETPYLFGHVGDGNLHVNITAPAPDTAFDPAAPQPVEDAVFQLVARYRGSISAEHGIGRAKAEWLHLARTESERAAMLAVKRALDPENRLGRAIWASHG